MATVPILNGPQVEPQARPTPFQNISAPAEAFGASVAGQSLGEAGKAAGQVSGALLDYASTVQNLYNKQAADTAGVNAAAAVDAKVSQWKQNNTEGQAVATYPQLLKDIETTRASFGQGLSPVAASDFESLSRRFIFSSLASASSYAAEQGRVGLVKGSDAVATQATSLYNSNPTPENEALAHEQVAKSAAVLFGPTGLKADDPQVQAYMAGKLAPMYANQIQSLYEQGKLVEANALADRSDVKDVLTRDVSPNGESAYVRVENTLRVANAANSMATGMHNALFGGGPAASAAGPDNRNLAQIEQDESGGRNIINYREARGEKGFTASGYYQITDPTWREFAPPAVAAQYPRAMDAPQAVQTQVAQAIQAKTGNARWAESAAGGRASSAPTALPGPGSNLDQWSADAMTRANAYAQQAYPGDIAAQERALGEAKKQIALALGPVQEQQKANYETALGTIVSRNLQDPNGLDQALPGLSGQVSPAQFHQLQEAAAYNGRIPTPAQADAEVSIKGQLAAAAAGALDPKTIDIGAAGLTPQQALPLREQQAQIENKKLVADKTMEDIMKSPSVASALQGSYTTDAQGVNHPLSEMTRGAHSDKYWQFYGFVNEEVQAFRDGHDGKPPAQQDVQQIVNRAFAKVTLAPAQGPSLTNWFGTPAQEGTAFSVPPDLETRIKAWYSKQGIDNPSQELIGEQYARYLRAQGTLR